MKRVYTGRVRVLRREGPLAAKYPADRILQNKERLCAVYDGSYHPVDSSEMAFKVATQQAFKKGIMEAKPVLLEPIATLKVVVPEGYTGDVMGELNKRRARVMGMNPTDNGYHDHQRALSDIAGHSPSACKA